jgi:hypothetical protein
MRCPSGEMSKLVRLRALSSRRCPRTLRAPLPVPSRATAARPIGGSGPNGGTALRRWQRSPLFAEPRFFQPLGLRPPLQSGHTRDTKAMRLPSRGQRKPSPRWRVPTRRASPPRARSRRTTALVLWPCCSRLATNPPHRRAELNAGWPSLSPHWVARAARPQGRSSQRSTPRSVVGHRWRDTATAANVPSGDSDTLPRRSAATAHRRR